MEIFRQNLYWTCTKFLTGFCSLLKRVGHLSKNKNTMKVVLLRWGKVRWFYWDDVSMFVLRTHCTGNALYYFIFLIPPLFPNPYSGDKLVDYFLIVAFPQPISGHLRDIFQPWQTWKYLSIYIPWQPESVSHPPELAQSHIFPILFYLGERRAEEVINWV